MEGRGVHLCLPRRRGWQVHAPTIPTYTLERDPTMPINNILPPTCAFRAAASRSDASIRARVQAEKVATACAEGGGSVPQVVFYYTLLHYSIRD